MSKAPDEAALVAEILGDPYYGSAYAVLGSIADILDAGYFSAGAERVDRADVEWMSVPLDKIWRRLAARERGDDRPAVVLVTTGAFSPVHSGHIQMMASARAELEARGYFVAGGYLSPSHDAYVASKLGEQALGAVTRLDLCQAVTADSDWLMASGWEALGVDRAINFTDVLVWTAAYLARHLATESPIEVVYVFGSDNARFVRTFVARGLCVCTSRPGCVDAARAYAEDPHVRDNPRILFARQSSVPASSSQIRNDGRIDLMEERSRRRYAQLTARGERPPGEERRGVIVLRDECGWEVAPWLAGRDREELLAARRWLHTQLTGLLRRVHADSGTELEIHWLRLDAQRDQVAALVGERVLSLDAPIVGDVNLAVSRCFALSGAHIPSVLSHRPDSAPLVVQLAALPNGRHVLVDDDACTGATLRAIRALLPERVQIDAEYILLKNDADAPRGPLLDVLDGRDFLAGAREGGLVVALPGGALARVPYCLPYASACERASVPLAAELGFSREIWRLNALFFERVAPAIVLGEASAAFRRLMDHLGFDHTSPMATICRWHEERCAQTIARADGWRATAPR